MYIIGNIAASAINSREEINNGVMKSLWASAASHQIKVASAANKRQSMSRHQISASVTAKMAAAAIMAWHHRHRHGVIAEKNPASWHRRK